MISLKLFHFILLHFYFIVCEEVKYCTKDSRTKCGEDTRKSSTKLILYDVNPLEGFNLKRDVYMRVAIMASELNNQGHEWTLVLPPWYKMVHWRSQDYSKVGPISWDNFFDLEMMSKFTPVTDLYAVNNLKQSSHPFVIDTLFVLQHYPDAFQGRQFKEKWNILKDNCDYNQNFWGYDNITVKTTECVQFQGRTAKLHELLKVHPSDKIVMFANAEIALHDGYGMKVFWDVRKSMKFSSLLTETANEYIGNVLKCNKLKCPNYISVHWRRGDFARSRRHEVPTVKSSAKQILEYIGKSKEPINKVYVATDADEKEYSELYKLLIEKQLQVYSYVPGKHIRTQAKDGSLAIIDQIICSRSAFFIGTHESTFTYRIQEEREIIGFNSATTFNRLCPDVGYCEKPSQWNVVN